MDFFFASNCPIFCRNNLFPSSDSNRNTKFRFRSVLSEVGSHVAQICSSSFYCHNYSSLRIPYSRYLTERASDRVEEKQKKKRSPKWRKFCHCEIALKSCHKSNKVISLISQTHVCVWDKTEVKFVNRKSCLVEEIKEEKKKKNQIRKSEIFCQNIFFFFIFVQCLALYARIEQTS